MGNIFVIDIWRREISLVLMFYHKFKILYGSFKFTKINVFILCFLIKQHGERFFLFSNNYMGLSGLNAIYFRSQ